MQNKDLDPLYRAYGTILECLEDRGYNINITDTPLKKKMTATEFFTFLKPGYRLIFKKKDSNWKIQIFFIANAGSSENKSLGKKDIESYHKHLVANKVQAGILILMNVDVTTCAKKEADSLKPDIWLEIFSTSKLQMNITRHEKVPKHVLLSEKEKYELLQKRSMKLEDMPKISNQDPVALYFAAQPGQVFKIVRESESCAIYTAFRVVI